MSDIDRIVLRLSETISYDLGIFLARRVEDVTKKCESPIEALLLSALMIEVDLVNSPNQLMAVTFDAIAPTGPSIVPQYQWEKYRIDIAIFWDGKPIVFVECDGHQFHERTPEQAERDRSRDRAIQKANIAALRFTGREINRDPFHCSHSTWEIVNNFALPPPHQEVPHE